MKTFYVITALWITLLSITFAGTIVSKYSEKTISLYTDDLGADNNTALISVGANTDNLGCIKIESIVDKEPMNRIQYFKIEETEKIIASLEKCKKWAELTQKNQWEIINKAVAQYSVNILSTSIKSKIYEDKLRICFDSMNNGKTSRVTISLLSPAYKEPLTLLLSIPQTQQLINALKDIPMLEQTAQQESIDADSILK